MAMPKGGQRRAKQKGKSPHKDRYAPEAARSQAERDAFNDRWAREHPVLPEAPARATTDSEEEEAV
jgi:hypothetical protein